MADPFSSAPSYFTNPSYSVDSSGSLNATAEKLSKNPLAPKNSFQYPLRMMDKQTDFLLIKIYDWVSNPEAFKLSTTLPFILTETKDSQLSKLKQALYYITLPIPSSISDSNSITWGDDTINPAEAAGLGLGSAAIQNPLEATKAAYQAVLNAAGSIDKNTMSAVNNAIGAAAVNTIGGNVSATNLISRATGQVLNTNLELLFQGVNLRQFPFTFDFIPRDRTEAEEVKQIIRTLKIAMTPSKGSSLPKGQNGGLFINSPKIFQLEYRHGGKPHPFLNRFRAMALTDMSVNYAASGAYATYDDATPVHLQMSLTFKEINPVYAEDYEDVGGVGY